MQHQVVSNLQGERLCSIDDPFWVLSTVVFQPKQNIMVSSTSYMGFLIFMMYVASCRTYHIKKGLFFLILHGKYLVWAEL